MRLFLIGFVTALLVIVPAVFLLLYWFKSRSQRLLADSHLKRLKELSRLTGGLAHEIKNPLSTVKINLKLVSEELSDLQSADSLSQSSQAITRAIRKLSVVQKETDRLEQILDGFLRYIDMAEPQFANADVNLLVSDMADFYSPRAQSNSITIRQGLYDQPLVCRVDADMLKQVMLNLFINAQRAMGGGGELILRTFRQKKSAVIEVSDTGVGIIPDRLPDIFDACHSSNRQGSGLGLPTVKRIVESHNGSVSVSSEPGRGTSFMIKLPLIEQD